MHINLTVIICTHHRAHELQNCLQSLLNQTDTNFKILVVNNCSADDTDEICRQFASEFTDFQLVYESKLGLSHARNCGFQVCSTDWLIYLDDDTLAFPDLIAQAKYTIQHFDFQCFGGIYHALHRTPRPQWFREDWGTNYNQLTEIQVLPSDLFASAGIMAIRRSVLVELGGFRTDIGRIGKKFIIGEETNLQVRMRKKGYKIGFNPAFQVHHLVSPEQLSAWWFVRRWYVTGLSFHRTFGISGLPENFLKYTWRFLRTFWFGFKNITQLTRNDYFRQNFIIDFVAPLAYEIGLWNGRNQH